MSAAVTPASASAACVTSTISDSMSLPSCLPNLLCAQPMMQPLMPPSGTFAADDSKPRPYGPIPDMECLTTRRDGIEHRHDYPAPSGRLARPPPRRADARYGSPVHRSPIRPRDRHAEPTAAGHDRSGGAGLSPPHPRRALRGQRFHPAYDMLSN